LSEEAIFILRERENDIATNNESNFYNYDIVNDSPNDSLIRSEGV